MKSNPVKVLVQVIAVVLLAGTWSSVRAADPIPKPAPLIKDGSWADTLKQHPRLLGSKTFLKDLAKAKPREYDEIKRDKSLMAAGIVHAVEGLPKGGADEFIKDAMKNVAAGATNTHQKTWIAMQQVALVYDQFYDLIAPADRQKMIAWLNEELVKFTADEDAFHNSTMSKIHCYLQVAYATWGENPKAKDFRDYALVKLYEGKLVPVLKEFGAGGGYTECGWYTRGSLWNLVQGLELARRFERYDGYGKAPTFFYQRMAYELLQPYPGIWQNGTERYSCEGDGSNLYSAAMEYPRLTRTVLAQYWRGSELSAYVFGRERKGSNSFIRMMDFLFEEKPDKPADIKDFPMSHLAAGIGKVYARGDWSDSASWLRFECGDPFTQHHHLEAGNFEIFRYEPLASESGEYPDDWDNPHAVNWTIRTIAHNCILIYAQGEKFTCGRASGQQMVNDGGQLENVRYAGDLATWKKHLDTNEHGQIVAYQNTPEFLYVAGDSTKAYSKAKASLVLRQIIFVRPNTFVILDRVNSTRPEYEKTWLLHCKNPAKVEGQSFVVADGKGKLTVQTLLPEKAKITPVDGYAYRGQKFDAPSGPLNAMAVKSRVEVTPTVPAQQDIFLHVLQTDDKPKAATLVRKNNLVGASGEGWEVLFDTAGGGTVTIGGKSTPFKPGVKPGKYE